VALSTEETLQLWDISGDRLLAETDIDAVSGRDDAFFFSSAAFTNDGEQLDISIGLGVARLRASDLGVVTISTATTIVQGEPEGIPGTDDVVGTGTSGMIWRWDMSTGRLVTGGRSRDTTSLYGAGVTPDGSLVAALQAFTSAVALFDADTLRPVGRPFPVGGVFFDPQFTPDGRSLVGNGLFGASRWDMDPAVWRERACLAAGRNLTVAEWTEYIGETEPYQPTCDHWRSDE
jgi:hypothetical protein